MENLGYNTLMALMHGGYTDVFYSTYTTVD